ncbi:Alkaline phosphatase 3 precursor [Roseimaritima multifibrata]|uniref:Alkaline phosphatase 3 n=1 Tax=Roseimaritima multifibrata TaxID=1930274 RepID=A0A517MBZ4_9BACT|nr:alkaline phosphatase [Roseimaritima multifibrata]QDS92408.1 Alkaline phosphatase 3 precursor [Roseimaritima multifibrata]
MQMHLTTRLASTLFAASLGLNSAIFAAPPAPDASEATKPASVPTSLEGDPIREMQEASMESKEVSFGHWGTAPSRYSAWTSHSNRLIPVYTFGMTMDKLRNEGSLYQDEERLEKLFGAVPENTLNPDAKYFDQTDVYRLQEQAVKAGKKKVILIVFDGMDWQTTRAAAIYNKGSVSYKEGRGTGLFWQDYPGTETDFGFFVTSPLRGGVKTDVNGQIVLGGTGEITGGYNPKLGGDTPWAPAASRDYLLGQDRTQPHTVTDSASSATSLTSGVKTYNGSINFKADSSHAEPIAHKLQRENGFAIGVVTSVPVSHATPGAAYAHNVTRNDYQDISRDLLGLPSSSHRTDPLPGVDVLLGGGWGEIKAKDSNQGENFVPGNRIIADGDLDRVAEKGAVVVQRTPGKKGNQILQDAAETARKERRRLVGFFGVGGGHLPFQTADKNYNPTVDVKGAEKYSAADIEENPNLAELATAALDVLNEDEEGFWLMVESGDVDWANHANNLDNSIGAVLSGDEAFAAIAKWVEAHDAWDETAIILTADHGHYLNLTDAKKIADANPSADK